MYMAALTAKCIKDYPGNSVYTHELWVTHNENSTNWYMENDVVLICGNMSGAT